MHKSTPTRAYTHQTPKNIPLKFQLLTTVIERILKIMTLRPLRNEAKMERSEREALLESLMLDEPELRFTPRGNPDSRLLRLVDFLARQAAQDCYAKEVQMMKQRRKRAS